MFMKCIIEADCGACRENMLINIYRMHDTVCLLHMGQTGMLQRGCHQDIHKGQDGHLEYEGVASAYADMCLLCSLDVCL